jgi:prepilin-type N-terminal cleavage/methylation domain-containing protein
MTIRGGFTLLEVMIAVAIIGLLAVIAVPSFLKASQSSMKSSCLSNLNQISGAKDQYALSNNGIAPGSLGDLVPNILRHLPKCQAGGTYTLGALNEDPICTMSPQGHTI